VLFLFRDGLDVGGRTTTCRPSLDVDPAVLTDTGQALSELALVGVVEHGRQRTLTVLLHAWCVRLVWVVERLALVSFAPPSVPCLRIVSVARVGGRK
jgi:hypothetical protein